MHRNFIFNLAEHIFSVCVTLTEKLFLTGTHRIIEFFCHYISVCIFLKVHRQKKYFSDGIRILLCFCTHRRMRVFNSAPFVLRRPDCGVHISEMLIYAKLHSKLQLEINAGTLARTLCLIWQPLV